MTLAAIVSVLWKVFLVLLLVTLIYAVLTSFVKVVYKDATASKRKKEFDESVDKLLDSFLEELKKEAEKEEKETKKKKTTKK